ncbi:MAG: SCO family protein [Pontixanthobacter sp.]
MNPNAMMNPFRNWFCLPLLAVAACSAQPEQPPLQDAPLYGSAIKGAFELVGQDGKTVRFSDFDGKFRIVYFGYAYCPDICPTDVGRMVSGLKSYREKFPELGKNIQPMFISIDPARDTPKVLREFTANFSDDLIGLTGSDKQIKQAAANFFVQYSRGEEGEGGGYLMDHSTITYLFGPKGEALATLPTDQGPQAVEAELEKWVR